MTTVVAAVHLPTAGLDRLGSPAAVAPEMQARFDDDGTGSAPASFLADQLSWRPGLTLARTSS